MLDGTPSWSQGLVPIKLPPAIVDEVVQVVQQVVDDHNGEPRVVEVKVVSAEEGEEEGPQDRPQSTNGGSRQMPGKLDVFRCGHCLTSLIRSGSPHPQGPGRHVTGLVRWRGCVGAHPDPDQVCPPHHKGVWRWGCQAKRGKAGGSSICSELSLQLPGLPRKKLARERTPLAQCFPVPGTQARSW